MDASGSTSSRKSSRHRRKLCEHCGENLSYSAYLSHRRLHYNSADDKWLKSQAAAQEQEPTLPRPTNKSPENLINIDFDGSFGKSFTINFQSTLNFKATLIVML